MIKTTLVVISSINFGKSRKTGNNKIDDSNETDSRKVEKNLSKASSSGTCFITSEVRIVFTYLRKVFTKASILHHFHPKCHIQIEINESGFTIGDTLSQMTSGYITYTNLNFFTSEIG